jgi:cytochrome c biogenesis protein CcmG, thiol:disulfide interchange protein DsbE
VAKYLLPLVAFVILVAFLGRGLWLEPREIPSPLIDKPAPAFSLPRLEDPGTVMHLADMKGKVWLLNVWASWCVACRQEHPVLIEFAKTGALPIYGLNYKEVRGDAGVDTSSLSKEKEIALAQQRAQGWLDQMGNPYAGSVLDLDGRVGIDYGVYGVPETFLIDKAGVIRYKKIGPITDDDLKNKILPKVKELQG